MKRVFITQLIQGNMTRMKFRGWNVEKMWLRDTLRFWRKARHTSLTILRVSVLPARATVVWHRVSATVSKAKDGKPMRHGLRFFRKGQSRISIALRRFDWAVNAGWGGCYPVTESQPWSGARLNLPRGSRQKGTPLETSSPFSRRLSLMRNQCLS